MNNQEPESRLQDGPEQLSINQRALLDYLHRSGPAGAYWPDLLKHFTFVLGGTTDEFNEPCRKGLVCQLGETNYVHSEFVHSSNEQPPESETKPATRIVRRTASKATRASQTT